MHFFGLAQMNLEQQSLFWDPIEESGGISRIERFLLSQAAAGLQLTPTNENATDGELEDPIDTFLASKVPSLLHLRPLLDEQGIQDLEYLTELRDFPPKIHQELWSSCLEEGKLSRMDLALLLTAINAEPVPF